MKTSRIKQDSWLRNTKIAHRGLWNENTPENSLSAYQQASDAGFAIEIDVYLTTDKEIVLFHDDTLTRMTGDNRRIEDCSLEQLKALRLNGTDEQIPTLKELFAIVEHTSPLLIEIKPSKTRKKGEIESILLELLRNYKGKFAVQSFDPAIVKWFKDNAPDLIRGQLATYFEDNTLLSKTQKWILKSLVYNVKSKPDFVSYDQENTPNKYIKRAKKNGKVIISWTITSATRQNEVAPYVDNFIFENYMPTSITND